MSGAEGKARPLIAPPDEDPNATIICSSPPCFMHELDPSYLGYLGRDEVLALIRDLLAAEWPASAPEPTWLHGMLRRHLAGLHAEAFAPGHPGAGSRPPDGGLDRLARRLREALPRLYDHALRHDLQQVLGLLEQDMQHEATPGTGQTMPSWDEVRRWRKAQREVLIAHRLSVPRDERERWNAAITARLRPWLPVSGSPCIVGFYWPFKGEYDPRPLMRSLHEQGVRLALPVVVERAQPLAFREWWPGIRMAPGVWGIPAPAEGEAVLPDALVAPLVGFDGLGYRLGYGGGYYDRTLAAMPKRPLAIGVGFELSQIETIRPQPHDIPMAVIVTEQRVIRIAGALPETADPQCSDGRTSP